MQTKTRREFLKYSTATGAGVYLVATMGSFPKVCAQIGGGSLLSGDVDKYVFPLVKPPAMPGMFNQNRDRYKIGARQFNQQILPFDFPETPVWSYGSTRHPETFNFPAFTVEARWNKTTQVQWENQLTDNNRNYLPHLLPVDPTLHWANPPGGLLGRDKRPIFEETPGPYLGPVPLVTHVHGAHALEDSDGYPEAWYLPNARNIPSDYARTGTIYDYFKEKYGHSWKPGMATFTYLNDQPATTLWYHDHTLGMTRLNVYAGPAGFWLIRGGPYDAELGYVATGVGDNPLGEYTEIPIAIQDRSFNADGTLFYPDSRAFFDGFSGPYTPDSPVAPIWNPEFFGDTMVVNGRTWPYLDVEQRRYRFRLLNGCNSRFLILKMSNGMPFYQIGADQGFLPETVALNDLLMSPAERADVIVDFTNIPVGTEIVLQNLGPDEPFGGGIPGVDFEPADPNSTGQVMQFRVKEATSADTSILPARLPVAPPLGPKQGPSRFLTLHEEMTEHPLEEVPIAALLGKAGTPLLWVDPITEKPNLGGTEEWRIQNRTGDAHPIHVHLVKFEVVGRSDAGGGNFRSPESWETGYKDTVIAYPGEETYIKAKFDLPGLYVWHCHIVEHEDNEMMRPMLVE